MLAKALKVSIIIPAREASSTIHQAVESILNVIDLNEVEIIIVNDGLDESITKLEKQYPVTVINGDNRGQASATNIGIRSSTGRILIFLDADCRVSAEWLISHLDAHKRYSGLLAVGGSICMEPNASFWARCDHYCSWYNAGPGLPATWIPNHPTANLSVRRTTFEHVGPFHENLPPGGVHQDMEWQDRLHRLGGMIWFEPHARVWHTDRDTLKGYLMHNYRWGYNSILVKSGSSVSRFPWIYRMPLALILGFIPFILIHTAYILYCWLRAGKMEPLLLSPFIFLGRIAYASGMALGDLRTNRLKRTN